MKRSLNRKRTVKVSFLILFMFCILIANMSKTYAFEVDTDGKVTSFFGQVKKFIEEKIDIDAVTDFFSGKNKEDVLEEEVTVKQEPMDAKLVLVNQNNLLPKEYLPEKTIDVALHIKSVKPKMFMEEEAGNHLIQMFEAMKEEGLTNLTTVSGLRNYDYQSSIFETQKKKHSNLSAEEAYKKASTVVAPPGASEHQTGLAIDVSTKEMGYNLNNSFKDTIEYKWLWDNSYKYGFIVRYTEEKSDITGIIFEPWHLRYLGAETAEAVHNSGLCYEEYYEAYLKQ